MVQAFRCGASSMREVPSLSVFPVMRIIKEKNIILFRKAIIVYLRLLIRRKRYNISTSSWTETPKCKWFCMGIIDSIGNLFMKSRIESLERSVNHPHDTQEEVLHQLLNTAQDTAFGKRHGFGSIRSYEQFRKQVPLNSYEDLFPYI